jgi:hypothetical protein
VTATAVEDAETVSPAERLRAERDDARAEAVRCARALAAAEQKNGELVRVCVALSHLNGALTRRAVADALGELVVNLLGSEEFAVFELQRGGRRTPLTSMGLDGPALDRLGARLAAEPGRENAGLAARIPLRVGTETVGEVAVVALLPHRPGLDEMDVPVLDVLSTAGGAALDAARLREGLSGTPLRG